MGNFSRQVHFAFEAVERARIVQKLSADGFQGDAFVQFDVFGFINLAHTTAGEHTRNPEPVGDEITRRKGLALRQAQGGRTTGKYRT